MSPPEGGENSSRKSVLSRLERLLHREAHALRMGHRDLLALPADERVERGECLAGLRWIREGPDGAIFLECGENLSKWRRGENLWLKAGDDEPGIAVVYERFDMATRILEVRRDPFQRGGSVHPEAALQLDPQPVLLDDLALRAIAMLRAGADVSSKTAHDLLELKEVDRSIKDADERFAARCLDGAACRGLDDSQKAAFVGAVAKRPVALVQGPPGSGRARSGSDRGGTRRPDPRRGRPGWPATARGPAW